MNIVIKLFAYGAKRTVYQQAGTPGPGENSASILMVLP